jgi:adenylate cyclase
VLLAASTVLQLRTRGRLRFIDRIRVKGRETAIEIFESLDHYPEENLTQLDQVIPLYEEGARQYLQRKWAAALNTFAQVLKIIPNDGPSWVHADRCLYYRNNPPDDRWDGVWTMSVK